MLKKFSVTGFKNFKNTITMDFSDVRDYRFHPECITDGLISTAIIYGKNAVGKTNFGLALFDIVSHLTMNSATEGLYDYYLNEKTDWASFEYVFQFGNDEIVYRYKKFNTQDLEAEYLELNSEELFSVEPYSHGYKTNFSGIERIVPTLNWDNQEIGVGKSYLKFCLYNSSIEKSHPLIKMKHFVNNMVLFRALSDNYVGEYIGVGKKSDYFDFIFNHIEEFNKLLKIAEINKTVRGIKDPDGFVRLYFDAASPMPFFKVASSGTRALYNFFYWRVLQN